MDKIDIFKKIINESNNIVFFGGAGVSTDSGIPDFRGENGLYKQKYKYSPEYMLSHTFFCKNPKEFYEFYKDKMNSTKYEPNITHFKLAELEKKNKLRCVITQNIDGLHFKAGSKNVLELHGSIYRNYCDKCHKFYDESFIFDNKDIPKCKCGGYIKPDVVLYEEPLNDNVFKQAIDYIKKADTLIIAGTSLNVYPAANLINYFKGKHIVLINKDKTNYDNYAELVFNTNMKDIFKQI